MSRTLPISEVKSRLPELVTGVAEREEEIIVTRKGRRTTATLTRARASVRTRWSPPSTPVARVEVYQAHDTLRDRDVAIGLPITLFGGEGG